MPGLTPFQNLRMILQILYTLLQLLLLLAKLHYYSCHTLATCTKPYIHKLLYA